MTEGQNSLAPSVYKIIIKGHLNSQWAEWFYDLTITHEGDGTTTLYGPLPDQTVLHSVLNRIRDMNLRLISVTKVETTPNGGAGKPCCRPTHPTDSTFE
jgi:hypothetical protein